MKILLLLIFCVQSAPIKPRIHSLFERISLSAQTPFEAYLKFEEVYNASKYRSSTEFVDIPLYSIDVSKAAILSLMDDEVPLSFIQSNFLSKEYLLPVSPFTQVIPFTSLKKTKMALKGRTLASRSMVAIIDKSYLGVKMPTTHLPSGLDMNQAKLDMSSEGPTAIEMGKIIKNESSKFPKDIQCEYLFDTHFLFEKKSKQGVLFRNLGPLQKNNLMIPLFSWPYLAKDLSQENSISVEEQGSQIFSLIGKCQARLALKYGLQMKTPNAQNFVLEFDDQLHLVKIIIKDLSDMAPIDFIRKHLVQDYPDYDYRREYFNIDLHPFTHATTGHFKEVFSDDLVLKFRNDQAKSYAQEIGLLFNADIPKMEEGLCELVIGMKEMKDPEYIHYHGVDLLHMLPITLFLNQNDGEQIKRFHQRPE